MTVLCNAMSFHHQNASRSNPLKKSVSLRVISSSRKRNISKILEGALSVPGTSLSTATWCCGWCDTQFCTPISWHFCCIYTTRYCWFPGFIACETPRPSVLLKKWVFRHRNSPRKLLSFKQQNPFAYIGKTHFKGLWNRLLHVKISVPQNWRFSICKNHLNIAGVAVVRFLKCAQLAVAKLPKNILSDVGSSPSPLLAERCWENRTKHRRNARENHQVFSLRSENYCIMISNADNERYWKWTKN